MHICLNSKIMLETLKVNSIYIFFLNFKFKKNMTLHITINVILFVSQRKNTHAKFENLRSQTQLTTRKRTTLLHVHGR